MKRPLCNGCKNRPKPIDNDVKEKYMTSPPQTCGQKGWLVINFKLALSVVKWGSYANNRHKGNKTLHHKEKQGHEGQPVIW